MNLKLKAYKTIRQKIIKCDYPPYTLLNEETLREEIGVSRTPIREALTRLEQESLVQILPKKGIMVTGISPKEVESLFEMRILIEPYALRHYGSRIEKDILIGLECFLAQQLDYSAIDKIYNWDDAFHKLIVDATENSFLINMYHQSYAQNIRLRILSGNYGEERLANSHSEHRAVIQHCLSAEWDKAAAALLEHLHASRDTAFAIISKLPFLFRKD